MSFVSLLTPAELGQHEFVLYDYLLCKKFADHVEVHYDLRPDLTPDTIIYYVDKDGEFCDLGVVIEGNPFNLELGTTQNYQLTSPPQDRQAAALSQPLDGFRIVEVGADGAVGGDLAEVGGLQGITFGAFFRDVIRNSDPSGSYQIQSAYFDDATTATGTAANDRFDTGGGDDVIRGFAGDDIVYRWRAGDLTFNGGAGSDRLIFAPADGLVPNPPKGVVANLATGKGLNPFGGKLTLSGVENVTGTNHDDRLTGNTAANELFSGKGGADVILGKGGADGIFVDHGFAGIETGRVFDGGKGVDTLYIYGDGSDFLNRFDVLHQENNTGVFAGATFAGFEKYVFLAPGFDFYDFDIGGGAAGESFRSALGENTLRGRGGDDTFISIGGTDTFIGGKGSDTVDYALVLAVTVNLGTGATGGGASGDTIRQVENAVGGGGADRLVGSGAANRLSGGHGDDTLSGGAGDDVLTGGFGLDRMRGGGGADTFAFASDLDCGKTRALADVIADFVADEDTIDLSAIDAILGTAVNDAFDFIGRAAFTGAGQVRSFVAGGKAFVEINVAGGTEANMVVRIASGERPLADDFIL